MINKIIELSVKNRLFVVLGTAVMVALGIWSVKNAPLDAVPDMTDTQVIVYSTWDRPPQIIEDQVTYPIISALLGAPKVKDVRGFSDYGFSYVYVIFEDNTDVYWARSRVIEYLSKIQQQLPQGVKTELGPDATGVGWVYQYALVDETGSHSNEELRAFQDWHLKYALQSVKGVAEVASIGGFQKQYQVIVDKNGMLSRNISISDVVEAVKNSNESAGARLLEFSGAEYMVTAGGYIKDKKDIEETVVKVSMNGIPVRVKDVARVSLGPDIRRGVSDYNGLGEAPGGIVIMRYKENAFDVIARVKEKMNGIKLPDGVKAVPVYDRSELIRRAVDTLRNKLIEEMVVVSLIIIIFLMHAPSAMIPILLLPIAVLLSFIPMKIMGLTTNIMSLGGIAIAIGAMVDAAIVVTENVHKKLARWKSEGEQGDYKEVMLHAIKEVGAPSFYSLLVIAVSFIPIFTLEAMEGKLFAPLAYTKNFAMFFAALLAITLAPVLVMTFIKINKKKKKSFVDKYIIGEIHNEEDQPISKFLFKIYGPAVKFVLERPKKIIIAALAVMLAVVPVFFMLGREFMPPLNEGSILYMPTTLPGISVTEASRLLQVQDKILKSFPEVKTVFGKAGRANTSTDPAPYSMMETTVVLKPQNEWGGKKQWYSDDAPEFVKPVLRFFWPERRTWEELIADMDEALKIPGQVNAFTMPIKGRIDMLTTGVRTPVGIKIYGDDLSVIEELGKQMEPLVSAIKGTRSVIAERTAAGYFVDFDIKRRQLARYGLSMKDVQMEIMAAIGGENITWTIEGRERYPINVRYPRDMRSSIEGLKNTYISTMTGKQIPLSLVADIKITTGPGMIRDENGRLAGYVYVDVAGRDIGSYVKELKKTLGSAINLPAGYTLVYSGQFESMQRVKNRMLMVVPLTLLIIFVLIYMNTKSYVKTFIVMLAVPFSLVGAVLVLYLLGYNMSVGVWCGIIALLGVDAETGIFMLLYLDLAYKDRKDKGMLKTVDDLKEAIHHGAVMRVRPKLMTVLTMFVGLLPIMWAASHEIGADVMKRIAAPMVGGIFTSFIMELLVYPAVYLLWRKMQLDKAESKPAEITEN
ncbi:MAG: CusA/CzcA family heavy metal efflux RND transporter [Candidatus Goldiibacteriota bacterium HGW-Goldbacteria-1]|jgi:Cu(I)/Ag(I) efflux system membrane protein CusA/SilA|nr:MAG: CusA/CzcA family heavy metal efflux RND transporter [Candidatus Goldiibacteriota bacterium HGW-Goldbacteria-1]